MLYEKVLSAKTAVENLPWNSQADLERISELASELDVLAEEVKALENRPLDVNDPQNRNGDATAPKADKQQSKKE